MTGTQWQLIVCLVIVAGAAWYVGRTFWNSAHPKKGGCGGCGCKSSPVATESQGQLISSGSITLRPARAGNEQKLNQSP
jgi:FeoB-associated Cys-rich membrane protein